MSTRRSTLFHLLSLFLLLSLLGTHQVYAKPRPDISPPSFTPSSSTPSSSAPPPTGPASSSPPPNNGNGATQSPNQPTQPTKSNSPPPSHSPSPTPSNKPNVSQADSSSHSSSPPPLSSTNDPPPSSSSASSSSPSFSPSSSVPHNTAVVDQTRTGLVVLPTPSATAVNVPSQNDPLSTDDSTPTDAAAGKPVSFLQNKGAVAGTFTVVGLVVAALIIFLGSYLLRKRRERNAFNGEYDEFDTGTQNWSGAKRFMGNRRDTYARSSFGMAAMAEKSSNHGHDYTANETLQDDLGTEMSHQEMRTAPFDPYQNNYALPSHNLGATFDDNSQYHQGYDDSHLAPPHQRQQPYAIPHHIPPISTFGHGNGPLIATATGSAPYQVDAHTQQNVSPDSVYTPTPIASHYAQNPYHLDSYYGGSTSLNPAPTEPPQQHQQYHEQAYHTSARDPSTRSGPTEWGVAC